MPTIQEKIALLLKKAEQVGAAEAEALTEAAEKMMLKHGIEQAAIDAVRLGTDRSAEKIVKRSIFFPGSYSRAMIEMACEVVQALGEMRVFYTRNVYDYQDGRLGKRGDQLHIVGFERDADQAVLLIQSLQLQCVVAMNEFVKNHYSWDWMSGTMKFNEKKGFIVGFGQGAGSRIRRNKLTVVNEVKQSSPGVALALVDRKQAVDKYMDDTIGKLGVGRSTKTGSGGRSAGYGAGRNANTGDKAVRSSHNAIGG